MAEPDVIYMWQTLHPDAGDRWVPIDVHFGNGGHLTLTTVHPSVTVAMRSMAVRYAAASGLPVRLVKSTGLETLERLDGTPGA
jgi:hypothetical protein